YKRRGAHRWRAPPTLYRYGVIGPPRLLQELGRSALGLVHWPLLPAPLPPSVGGDGFAAVTGAMATPSAATANSAAIALRIRLIIPLFRCSNAPLWISPTGFRVQRAQGYLLLRKSQGKLNLGLSSANRISRILVVHEPPASTRCMVLGEP